MTDPTRDEIAALLEIAVSTSFRPADLAAAKTAMNQLEFHAPFLASAYVAAPDHPAGDGVQIDPPDAGALAVLRLAGCTCDEPLIGYRPGVGPRCRLCNVHASPAAILAAALALPEIAALVTQKNARIAQLEAGIFNLQGGAQ